MAAPANDNFVDAILLTGENGSVTGTNSGATNEAFDGDRKPVWYKWVAPFTGKISFDTLSTASAVDSFIIVYRDSYGSNTVTENDDYSSTNYRSYVKFNVILGATYYIGVGSYHGAPIGFTLHWQIPPAPAAGQPVNDSYIDPITLPGTSGMVSSTTHGNIDDETLDEGAVWFLYTPAANGTVTFTLSATNGGSFWTVDAWKGESYKSAYWQPANSYSDTGTQVVVTYPAQVGLPYHIGVVMNDDAQGDFTIAWDFALPQAEETSGLTYSTIVSDYDLMYRSVYNESAGELWVEQERYPQIIARFNESSGELVGYITYSETPSDPIYYDSFSQKIWVPLTGGRVMSVGALPPFVKGEPVSIPLQYGAAFSPIDGSLWTTHRGSPAHVKKWNPLTGEQLADYTIPGAFDIQFAKDGRAFLKIGNNSPYTDTVYAFNTTTGVATPLGVDNDIARFALVDDRNSLFAIRYVGGPSASTSSLLTEYSLDDGSELASYSIPYYDQWSFYYYFIYDHFHRRIWINDASTGELGSYDIATGDELSVTTLATSGSLTASPSGVWVMGNNSVQRVGVPPPVLEGIINDRDVWLQTFAERFEKTTVQPGTVVNQTQANGTGIALASSKSLALSFTKQAFIVKDGTSEPVSITLTAALRNLAGPPAYSVVSGSATLVTSGDRAQLTFPNMASDRVTVRATVTDGGVTYEDQVTLVKIDTGGTAITPLLTNERHAVMADHFGNVLNYMGASGDFRLWEGAFEVTADADFAIISNTADLLCGITNLGRYTVFGMPESVDSATLVLRATYHGTNYDQTFTITKIKAPLGSPGDPTQQDGGGGSRLPVNLRIPVVTTTWDSQIATNATAQYGGNILNDIVTQYNNVANWQETRFWNFQEWLTMEALIDGNLLVRGSISADKISANAIESITGSFDDLLTQRLAASEAQIDTLIADSIQASRADIDALVSESIQASRAEIDTLVANEIDAVTANIDTLTVGTLRLEDGSVITSKIGANAVTVPAFLNGDAGGTTINAGGTLSVGSATVNYPDAAEVAITANWTSGNNGAATNSGIRVKIDGVTVGTTSDTQQSASTQSHSAVFKGSVGAGSHTISVELTNDWTSGSIQARAWAVLAQASMR